MKSAGRLTILRMFLPLLGRVPMGHLWYLWRKMRNEKPHRFGRQVRINTFFPPWPSEAFRRFCRSVASRRRVPYSVYVGATGRCPYRCEHCSYAGRGGKEMSTAELIGVIRQIDRLGACTLGLTGGEPLERADLPELVSAAAPMATIVFTTGHGLDDGVARRLAEAGVGCVTVGLESSDAAAHDAVRGVSGSFAVARRAVEACRAAWVYTAISTVGFREKIFSGELERLCALAAEWGAGEFRVLAPVATGGMTGCAAAMLSPGEMRALYDLHVTHNRRRGGPAVASFAYLEADDLFGCGAGYHHLYVDAAGEVCPCDLTPLSFGNVLQKPLEEIWQEMAEHFAKPRCGCLMGQLSQRLAEGASLPLAPDQSARLVPPRAENAPLPEGHRRLLL